MSKTIIVGISVGDINGTGLEVILKCFKDKRMLDLCTPVIFGEQRMTLARKKSLGLDDVFINPISNLKEVKPKKVNLFNSWKSEVKTTLGKSTSEGGKYALISLQKATESLKKKEIDVLVTAPINKDNIQSENFNFPGHTEYLEKQFQGNSLMLMISQDLKIGVVTGHIPLAKVTQSISQELIEQKLQALNTSLIQDFGIRKPKIAVLGLNPHASDNGLLGDEEKKVIIPAIKRTEKNVLAFGPYSADGFFGSNTWHEFDGVLAMYHDQGLIPFKTLSFGQGVNFTSGLDAIRTSPDHGTGFDIASRNIASETSFRQAIYTACDIFKKRKEWQELNKNPLKITAKKPKTREP